MKKIISVFIAAFLILSLSVNAFAETVKIDEFKLSFDFPENWYVATKDTPEDSDVFEYYLYYNETMEYIDQIECSVFAVANENMDEILLFLEQTNDYVSIKDLDFVALEETKKNAEESYSSYGCDDLVINTYKGAIETFITISYTDNSSGYPIYCLDYAGFVDGIYIELCFSSYDGPVSELDKEGLNSIVDSIISENVVPESSSSSHVNTRSLFRGAKAIFAAIVAAITGFVAWIKKKFGKNKTEEPIQNEGTVTETFENENPAEDVPCDCFNVSCPSCGARLSEDEKFCPLCGTKIK